MRRRARCRTAAVLLAAVGVSAVAAVPAHAARAAETATASPTAAGLAALGRADEIVASAGGRAGGMAPSPVVVPDAATLLQHAQDVAAYVGALPAGVRAAAFPDPARAAADTRTVIDGLGLASHGAPLPDARAFADAAVHLADGVRVAYLKEVVAVDAIDVGALADETASLVTYATAQAGQLTAAAGAILDGLPTPDALLALVGQIAVHLLAEYSVDALTKVLPQVDADLLWLGAQVAGPLGVVGPTAEQALAAAGGLVNAVATYAASGGNPQVGIEPAPLDVPDSLTVAAVDVPVAAHVMRPPVVDPLLADTLGVAAGPTVDSVNDAAAGTTGYRCYTINYAPCAPPLTFHGGAVQHAPRVYVVFWGPKWTGLTGLQDAVTGMFGALSGSAFQQVLSQYYDTTGTVTAGMTFAGAWVDPVAPPPVVDQTMLVNEAVRARAQNTARHWSTSDDTQWMVFTQPGTANSNKGDFAHCGFHNYGKDNTGRTWVFGVVDYPGPTPAHDFSNCTQSLGPVGTELALVAAHEYAEAATDPLGHGWFDDAGEEIADLCARLAPSGGVPLLWSNDGGAGRCASSFTPRYTYQVTSAVAPPPETANGYARGHAYLGGHVIATNTGNMPWFPGGQHPTRLGTWGAADRCSHVADMNRKGAANSWLSCRRIAMAGAYPVEPRGVSPATSSATFDLGFKPDGFLFDGKPFTEQFNLVGDVWMAPSAGGMPTLTANTAQFAAAFDQPATGMPVRAGAAGLDVDVELEFTVKATAPWYKDEVVYLGTAPNDAEAPRFADATWPASAVCDRCRAARVGADTRPGEKYTFAFTLHVPANMGVGRHTLLFQPVADVPVNTGGVTAKYFGPTVPVTLLVVGVPPSIHGVLAAGTVGSEPTEGYDLADPVTPRPYGHWFGCAAVASGDAVRTSVDACSLQVTYASGGTAVYAAAPTTAPGAFAATFGRGAGYDTAAGDTAVVCWTGSATFPDGSTRVESGCGG